MSESPKMGLFGSKDKTKETKKEGTKDDSPDRYAPYCIDSDSETYDTEALSMMDINDIIGVQSEAVSDSTLESEIAALSQIITDSKTDGTHGMMDTNPGTLDDSLSEDQELLSVEGHAALMCSKDDQLRTTLEELEKVCSDQEIMSACAGEQFVVEKSSLSNDNDLLETVELNKELNIASCSLKEVCKSDTVILPTTMTVGTSEINEDMDNINKVDSELAQLMSIASPTVSESNTDQEINNSDNEVKDAKSDEQLIGNISISGSLQLIGEAYTSEDSQETSTNEVELKDEDVLIGCTERADACSTKEKDSSEICEKICESQQNVNNTTEISDMDLSEVSTKEHILAKKEDYPLQDVEVNAPDCAKEHEVTEELSNTSENITDLASSDCKDAVTLMCENIESNEAVNTSSDNIDNIKQVTHEEIIIGKGSKLEENTTMEESELEVNSKIVEPSTEVCVSENEERKTESMEVNGDGECQEANATDNESKMDESTSQEHDLNTSEKGNCAINTETTLNTDEGEKLEVENDSKVNDAEKENKDIEKEESLLSQLENTEKSAVDEIENLEPLDTTDNCSIPQNVSKALEFLEMQEAKDSEKLEAVEEMQSDPLKSFVTDLFQETNTPIHSEEKTSFLEKDNVELSLKADDIFENAVNEIDNIVAEVDEKINDNINPDTTSNTDVNELTSVDLLSESTELKIEDKLDTAINDEVVSGNEVPLEAEKDISNTNCTASTLEAEETLNVIKSLDSALDENNSNKEEAVVDDTNDSVKNNVEVSNMEILKPNDWVTHELEEEQKNVKEVTVTELNTKEDLNSVNISTCVQEKDVTAVQDNEDMKVDFTKEEENNTQMSNEEQKEEASLELRVEEEQLAEKPASMNISDKVNVEESVTEKDNENILLQSDMNVEVSENKNDADDKEIPDLKFIENDDFSLPSEQNKNIALDEDTEEDEEMNLTLEPEETESQTEEDINNAEEVSAKEEAQKNEEVSNEVETLNKGEVLNQQDVIETVEEMKKEIESPAIEIKGNDSETSNTEEAPTLDPSTDALCSTTETPEDLMNKQDIEDNLRNETESSNLKSILETATNVVEMFSGEQSQNTQDIVKSILDDVNSATDFKNILGSEEGVANEIEQVLQQSTDLPLVGTEMEELTEKSPQSSTDIMNKDSEDPISAQNIDSLEGLLGLDLIQEGEDSAPKADKMEEGTQEQETLPKEVDMSLLLDQSNRTEDMAQGTDYITDVISSCLRDTDSVSLQVDTDKSPVIEAINTDFVESEVGDVLKVNENIITESMDKDTSDMDIEKRLEVNTDLQDNELDMDFEENPLESVDDLEETESKLDLAPDILLQNVDQGENLNDTPTGIETSQPSSEISELESAVKFLQESEEQAIDSPLVLSPKMVESVVDDISKQANASSLFVPDEDICEDASELVAELQNITTDSISISEAEIISEAAKLESERKLEAQAKIDASMAKFEADENKLTIDEEEKVTASESHSKLNVDVLQNLEIQQTSSTEAQKISESIAPLSPNILKISEPIPKVSILEERLKEPPKIEIPITDVTKASISPTTSKDSLLIQKDVKLLAYQRMLESPKLSEKSEPKIMETPRKDCEKHDFENVGSPRIILKIAKSAITDCGEPRSPKSPKIRSATNSPNPEDSPGQKLGKIKLKLSKGGHPSIISNENIDEVGQWHSEGTASLSPIGMKIKLSKSGDASIVTSEKHESTDDSKEIKHKFEESKRTESPIGMKIKLSKTGDASIVQDSKEMQMKHKEKLDIVQGSPKRTESPIGMKIKLSKSGDASIIQPERQDTSDEFRDNIIKSKDMSYDSPKRTESPIGMKIKLSKSGDASIVSPDISEEGKQISKLKEKLESPPEVPKRTDSPIGMKIKLAKTKGGASIISVENTEETKEKLDIPEAPKRTDSPLGMKIKLSKSGDASIVHSEVSDEVKDTRQKERVDIMEKADIGQEGAKLSDASCGMKVKVTKSGETTAFMQESSAEPETMQEVCQKVESPIGMKIKLSKFGDASIIPTEKQEQPEEHKAPESLQDMSRRTESPIGMKIKLSKTGDASIIQSETSEDSSKPRVNEPEHSKSTDAALGMKIKLLKSGDASIVDPKVDSEKKEKQQRRRDVESPLEMKIKLSKTGHPTIVACESHAEPAYKPKDSLDPPHNFGHRYKEPALIKEPALKILKAGHSTILQSNRSELTIEPVQMQTKKVDNVIEISPKRKEITISPVESKKSKLETQLSQILPEVTIQPVMSRDQKQLLFDPKTSVISRQQMNVISQEISITQVRPSKAGDSSMSEKLKDILSKNTTGSPLNSDCEIIEHRPELIIVNENSNSSQDVVIIEEVPTNRMPEVKIPKKRGRPRRNPLPQVLTHPPPPQLLAPRDPASLDKTQQGAQPEHRENERPKRTCRNQKSYAPPRRGRGRGRGKRKLDNVDLPVSKKPRVEQDLSAIEASTMAVITLEESSSRQESLGKSPELYKALKQPPMDSKSSESTIIMQSERGKTGDVQGESSKIMPKPSMISTDSKDNIKDKKSMEIITEKGQKTPQKAGSDDKPSDKTENVKSESKDMLVPPGHSNWLTPTSKRQAENTPKHENVSTVQVIDEETRMSAESGSRSQTPARNISVPASETIVNEESQGSVLSTATTESEKVKVKNRRMEINFDPDEGPFTVDKIAEYEWPLDRKGETFMIQEQISQYLGVKSFKRKYPDLKRRVVDMEERNYLRENGLVSEAMCDMGLTAVCSSEVLDVMCSDFPDQYEEYRKHMREKQVKEHSKKQKELTAAANAEKNRIDLAEMAVQSALSWNSNLNKARKENRKCSLDLQTFTIHVPKKQQKVETERRVSHYPVALIPGQYTDYYREYTAAELRYYPLNTVLYGPMRPNERKFDSQSEGSQSDSDSDSSSDDSSSSSSEGTQDTEGSQSTMDEVDMEIVNQKDEIKLKCKMCLKSLNKHSKNEVLIQCGTCNGNVHPSCIDLTLDMVPHIQSYAWQCTDCKTCAQCHDPADEDKMLFCDMCDRGYHIYCVGLRRVPQGRWHCQECAVCANCSSREPGGVNSDRNSVAQWQHEYKKGDKNTRVYVSTLCVPCSKMRGDQGNTIRQEKLPV